VASHIPAHTLLCTTEVRQGRMSWREGTAAKPVGPTTNKPIAPGMRSGTRSPRSSMGECSVTGTREVQIESAALWLMNMPCALVR
jgi:hypothetical protein